MSKRLTRKQIKEDIRHGDLQTAVSSTYEQIHSHQRLIVGAVVAVAVLVAAFVLVRVVMANRTEAATKELAKAVEIYDAPVGDAADGDLPATALRFASDDERRARAREALQAIAGGTPGRVAGLYLAELALREGDTATARQHWQDYLAKHDDDLLAVSVRLNLIRLDRQEGRGEEVAARLEDDLAAGRHDLPEDVLLFELALTLDELGRGDDARDYYQRLLDDHPRSPYAAEARRKMAS